MIPVLRVQSLSLLIMAFSCVQNSLLVREMKFKKTLE
ncbi:oligosaccharide flippase family protein [Barnesiella sp. GGCC_0306]|nr:oligosaccharide flippase family protein [Barnesiella sp. GGCC_0306]